MDTSLPAELRILFLRQFAVMLAAGVDIRAILAVQAQIQQHQGFRKLLEEMLRRLEGGSRLSTVFARYPRAFPRLIPIMLRVGEETGRLYYSIELLAVWAERDQRTRRRVISALVYPSLVCLLALTLLFLFLAFVVPGFAVILNDFHTTLPLGTRVLLGVSSLVRNPVLVLLAVGLAGAAAYNLRGMVSPAAVFGLAQRVPVLGRVLRCATWQRFCAAWALMLKAGVDLRKALPLACEASGSPALQADSELLVAHLVEGELLSAHMKQDPRLYSPLIAHMVAVGEESAQLPTLLARLADVFEAEVEAGLDALAAALEPLILLAVAFVTGGALLALLLPLYSAISQIGA